MIRVLIVEDDPVIIRGHRATVAAIEGFEVAAVASTGRDALSIVPRGDIDLVLLDIGLPDIGGLEVCRALRAAGHRVDVFAISAARDVDTVRDAVDLGIVEYVVKPFPSRLLREKLVRHRELQRAVAGTTGAMTQGEIDHLLARQQRPAADWVPKGLSAKTLDAVIALVREDASAEGCTAGEVARSVGLSVRSARRYLAHLADIGCASATPTYGGPGRPELRYRWVSPGG